MQTPTIGRRALLRTAAALPVSAAISMAQQAASGNDKQAKLWNGVYSSSAEMVTSYPNRFLAEVVNGKPSGRALDVGAGQGRNSLYLARQGWDVTGVDLSVTGVEIAQKQAEKSGLKFKGVVADFDAFDPGTEAWDLVVGIYMGNLITKHGKRIAAALRPGGLLVVENYHADLSRKGITGDPLGYSVNVLLEVFTPLLRVVRYEEFRDFPDWGNRGEKVPLVHMLAKKG